MKNIFNSKYPIVEACMNGGSSIELALACWEAGIFPSVFCQYPSNIQKDKYIIIEENLKKFKKITGSCNIIFALDERDLFDKNIIFLIKSYEVSHLEIFSKNKNNMHEYNDLIERLGSKYEKVLNYILKNLYPIKIIWRTTDIHLEGKNFYTIPEHQEHFLYALKGSDSAGVNGKFSTMELFLKYKKKNPNLLLLPYGGIGTPKQVKEYISAGAVAVAIGTLFAISKESPLSTHTKKKMLNAQTSDITKLKDTKQNSLILGKPEEVYVDNSGWNKNESLKKGLYGDGKQGHIYVGNSIENIKEIKSIKKIVEYLVSELPNY